MKNIRITLIAVAALAAIVVVSLHRQSHAQTVTYDQKLIPASACSQQENPSGYYASTSQYGAALGDLNRNGASVTMSCPIVRDNFWTANELAFVHAYAVDATTTAEISCKVWTTSVPLSAVGPASTSGGSVVGTGIVTMTPAGQTQNLTVPVPPTQFAPGLVNLVCTLPPLTVLVGYSWQEKTPTDND